MSDTLWKTSAAKNYVLWGKTDFISANPHLVAYVTSMKVIQDDSVSRLLISEKEIRYSVECISSLDYRVFRFYLFALLAKYFDKLGTK